MSLSQVKSYFRTRCDALTGYKEHKDAFNWQNIGDSGLNKSYHITLGDASIVKMTHGSLIELGVGVTVRLFYKGYRDPSAGVDTAMVEAEKLIKSSCKASNRLGASLKSIGFNSMSVEPYADSNDNSILSTLNFTASVLIDAEGA